jgi:parallel beta-helix repeat protein
LTNVVIQGSAFLNIQNTSDPDFLNAKGRGISARKATNVSILSSVFSGNQDVAILLGKEDTPPKQGEQPVQEVFVSNTNISSNLFDASLSAQSSGASVVLLNGTSLTLTKNIIRGGSTVGIQVDAEDGLQPGQPTNVSLNDVSGVNGTGLFFSNSLLGASIARNTVNGNSGNGVVVSEVATFVNAFNAFSRNKVTNNGIGGFLLFNAIGNSLDNNAITGNGFGIVVDRSQDNYFRNNVIRSSTVDGIAVDQFGSGNVFTRNRIQASGRFDIYDASIGDDTYGTRNIYRSNKAAKTNPPELGTAK